MIMNAKAATVLTLALLFLVPAGTASGGAQTENAVLLDMGNGTTYWSDVATGGTYVSSAGDCARSLGLGFESSVDSVTRIGEMAGHSVGGRACGWHLYVWDGSAWKDGTSPSSQYPGGCFAWGFYPDGHMPAETPDNRIAWTAVHGDSASTGISDSHGPSEAVTPAEWYRTYTNGYVNSSIVVADDLLYHTTGGTYGASGTDRNPWLHCLDRNTGEIVWEFMYRYGQGYEVTTPLIIGDMIIVSATNWDIYCLDRHTGALLGTLALEKDFPMDPSGDVVWDGRLFHTGATTPVYDSGAVYFGTADGKVEAYALDRTVSDGKPEAVFSKLWEYDPDDTCSGGSYTGVKGCFYYHAPVIADVDGVRMLFMGSYEGYAYALDASTGEEIWVERLINLGAGNKPHPGSPGSVSNIAVTRDGRLIVGCSDGGMDSTTAFTLCVDASTGKGPEDSDCYWRLDIMCRGPVVTDDGFYAYASGSHPGASWIEYADGTRSPVGTAVYMFDMEGKAVWATRDYPTVKAPLTLADGVLYMTDYSAGGIPDGGNLTAISAGDGREIWRVKLSPFTIDSYSMVSPTVIDGRVYVGNDYGAVYCVSSTMGTAFGDGGEIVLGGDGFTHWSWFALLALAILGFVFLYRHY